MDTVTVFIILVYFPLDLLNDSSWHKASDLYSVLYCGNNYMGVFVGSMLKISFCMQVVWLIFLWQ